MVVAALLLIAVGVTVLEIPVPMGRLRTSRFLPAFSIRPTTEPKPQEAKAISIHDQPLLP